MADTRSSEQRRRIMQSVKRRDTGPEMAVRHLLHCAGYRYRLHVKGMPGSPDLVFPSRRKVVFVHGCYWHGHDCRKGKLPKSRLDYWGEKIAANRERDARKEGELRAAGWSVTTVWQCELTDSEALETKLRAFLGEPRIRSTSRTSSDKVEEWQPGE